MQMGEAIIENFNKVVTDKDIVYHLGDFCWKSDPNAYLSRLKGKEHHLILGNHDKEKLCEKFFTSVQDTKLLILKGLKPIWLSHYAHRVWPQSHYGSIHLFGHSHGTLPVIPSKEHLMDIGVDCWGYYPVSLEKVLEHMGLTCE
jgi:calcineurin-like phosphoesterase family protein